MVEAAPGRLHLCREDPCAIQRITDALTRFGCQVDVFPGSREVTVPTDVDRRWLARVLDAHCVPCLWVVDDLLIACCRLYFVLMACVKTQRHL
ncbi:hypothetical protein HDE77_002470 [Rhodanobacter sp. MP7CTX1]|nr:hypothetical protein [Rhodanobacter sp. MP7CTX1]